MKIVVIGLGSMGKRRIRLLKKINPQFDIVGVDSDIDRTYSVKEEFGINTFCDLERVLSEQRIDCAIVSTSPLSHGRIIKRCLSAGLNVFSEINLVEDMYEENIRLAKEKNKVLFLSSTFLYRKEIQYIMRRVAQLDDKLDYVYHVGQYLPDWHPWETYNDFFVCEKRTNGCREILAIELPWIITAFGDIDNIKVLSGKNSSLGVNYNDNYLVLLKHKNGHKGVMAADVISRKPVRNLEIYGENIYLCWNGNADGLREYDIASKAEKVIKLYDSVDRLNDYSSFVIENAYEEELNAFFTQIEKGQESLYGFERDIKTLSWIDVIEKGDLHE